MELTRRDAAAALAGLGILGGGATAAFVRGFDGTGGDDRTEAGPDEDDLDYVIETLVAVAGVVYPSAVGNVPEFVEAFARPRLEERAAHREGVREAVSDLDAHASINYDADRYVDLHAEARENLLYLVGANAADPDPNGTTAERVRYYLVNDLLYALYASPTGGRLVGIENPQGHPGGIESYRQPPES